MEQLAGPAPKVLNRDDVLAELQTRLTTWRGLLDGNTPKARGLLRQLIVGRLELAPDRENGLYRFRGIELPIVGDIHRAA